MKTYTRRVWDPSENGPKPDLAGLKADAGPAVTELVMKLVHTRKVDVETALLAVMAQCAAQLVNRKGPLRKLELVQTLQKSPAGRKLLKATH